MTAPATLSRERIEQLIRSVWNHWILDYGDDEDVAAALRELMHLGEQVEALKEYVDLQSNVGAVYLIRDDEERAKAQRERWDRMDALSARIGRNPDGTWADSALAKQGGATE